ncbi:MAG: bifunctional riboflavin kinase/FAD synthetase [Ectothiorhodospiraceae bacterium]|jgi:riboflavin kinase/FMN adenylyltransferase
MELIRGSHNLRPRHNGCAATIGNFDGVHRGHQEVLRQLRQAADARDVPATVITFEPHPREFFAPDAAPARITGLRDKLRALAAAGVDRVLCLEFGNRLARMSAEDFASRILVERLGVRYLMVGDDFRFGRGREGDYRLLGEVARSSGFELTRMPTVALDSERVSSTRVREALSAGDLASAKRLLGRAYTVSGRVAHGDALGRELGWPTANLAFKHGRCPLGGIFVVEVRGVDGSRPGVASVGTRPTVGGTRQLLEVHLLDYAGDLYGRHIEVRFLEWLRGEEHFESLDELKEQIGRDVVRAREFFAARGQTDKQTG